MADSGIKKYRQEYADLPPISSETEGYSIRYRIISEDRNRVSHWSPVYLIIPDYTYVPELNNDLATITTTGAHYMAVDDWVTVEGVDSTFNGTYKINAVTTNTFTYYKDNGNIPSTPVSPAGTYKTNSLIRNATGYDIWLRWDRNDGGDWVYKERIQTTSISYPHPSFYTINGVVQPSAPNRLSVEVYLTGQPIARADGAAGTPFLKVYRMLNQTI